MKKLFVLGLLLVAAAPAGAQDAIDLRQATIHNSPGDIATWPTTTVVTHLTFRPDGDPLSGLSLMFDAQGRWPGYIPPNWGDDPATRSPVGRVVDDPGVNGALQYTVWACAHLDVWHCGAFIQMWQTRPSTGAPLPSDYIYWWGMGGSATAGYFGDYVPRAGDQMAFFVSAGDARGQGAVTSVRERSNVVVVGLPNGDSGDFAFTAPAPVIVAPPPVVTPPPVVVPPPPVVVAPPVVAPPVSAPPVVAPVPESADSSALLSLLAELEVKITALQQQESTDVARILAAQPLPAAALPIPPAPIVVNGSSTWLKVFTSMLTAAVAVLGGIGVSK